MKTKDEVIKAINGLLNQESTPEFVEQVGGIIKDVEEVFDTQDTLVVKNEELRKKYIDSITHGGFSQEKPVEANPIPPQPKTLEECLEEASKQN